MHNAEMEFSNDMPNNNSMINTDYTHTAPEISELDYQKICGHVHDTIGISLGGSKQALVTARLAKRLRAHNLTDYGDYFTKVVNGSLLGEEQIMLDLLTTNETYLFREPAHFNFLRDEILSKWNPYTPFNAWCAACSTGEEVFSIAMTIQDQLEGNDWEVLGSDISNRALQKASTGKISMQRFDLTPKAYLKAYCKKGVNSEEGVLLISKRLRQQIRFRSVNLAQPMSTGIGTFDVIFLRNVLIYFEEEMRNRIVTNIIKNLTIGGHFFISHTESLANIHKNLEVVQPSIYKKISA